MKHNTNPLRAIDLYSGVGGWSLGLRLAGISVVASYDYWEPANVTNRLNNGHDVITQDIREMNLSDLPDEIDIVVGSPPCTQFSFANRGGNGDIEDGIRDIYKFLSVVEHLRPAHWAMENVPRVRGILKAELSPGGRLERFRHLVTSIEVFAMEKFGLPQKRLRCIAGNYDIRLLGSYATQSPSMTLGSVVEALAANPVFDPQYGLRLDPLCITDHVTSDVLSEEEARMNYAAKSLHPVYNLMSFPDSLSKPVRTITATCTRVSRESVIIENGKDSGTFRRLSIRERATLQGFPITYQFYGRSYSQKVKLVGNAIPPPFAFQVAHALLKTPPSQVPGLSSLGDAVNFPEKQPQDSNPEGALKVYPETRRFRFAIPSLRLKSGVRFELTNDSTSEGLAWGMLLVFGTSKQIHTLRPRSSVVSSVFLQTPSCVTRELSAAFNNVTKYISLNDLSKLQSRWTHRSETGAHPFELLDILDQTAKQMRGIFLQHSNLGRQLVAHSISADFSSLNGNLKGVEKLIRNSETVASGIYLGSMINDLFPSPCDETSSVPCNSLLSTR